MDLNQLPLETRSLRLRQFVPSDAATALILSNEESARAGLPSQVYRDYGHALSAIEFLMSQYSMPGHPRQGPYVLAIEHRASSTLIGHVGFSPLDEEVEIGFSVAEKYQRQGFASEAIVAASRWAFEAFKLNRILALTSATNLASRRTLLRARFAYEGDQTMRFQGAERQVSVYALSCNPGSKCGA
ncbi:MAG: GNAT family N-acetyltransferase [bacterium]